jgi:hypothetical protein
VDTGFYPEIFIQFSSKELRWKAQMAKVVRSLVATGHVIRGVCYAKPDYLAQRLTELSAIPPERIGLNGEYDHYGLAKRIQANFYQQLGRGAVAQVAVKQRGSAVIVSGQVDTLPLLDQLVELALQAEGASHVEVQDVHLKTLNSPQPVQVA